MSPLARPLSPVPRPMSPSDNSGRFSKAGSGEWLVYGSNRDRLSRSQSEELPFEVRGLSPIPKPMSPSSCPLSPTFWGYSPEHTEARPFSPCPLSPPSGTRWFGKAGSGEWLVYGNSANSGRISKSRSDERLANVSPRAISPTGVFGNPGSPERGSGEWMVYRNLSPQRSETEELQFDSQKRTMSPPNVGRFGKSGRDWLVYGNISNKQDGGGVDLRQRAMSPEGGRLGKTLASFSRVVSSDRVKSGGVVRRSSSVESGGKLKTPKMSSSGKSFISSIGKMVNAGGNWKLGRKNKTKANETGSTTATGGGRVITSGPIKSSGSGTAANKKDRVSVCKMAAMSMSAAGKERSHETKKAESEAPPSVQKWLSQT